MKSDEILARELGKVGAMGGKISGGGGGFVVGKLTRAASALGGASGASLVARYLPTETCSREVALTVDATKALTVIVNVLARLGKLQDNSEAESPNPRLAAVVGSGFWNMNPCLLTVEIVAHGDREVTAVVSGAAKEGLIKQRTAEKAVTRVIEAIQAAAKAG